MSIEDREKLGQNGFSYYKEHFDHDELVIELISHFELLSQNAKELN